MSKVEVDNYLNCLQKSGLVTKEQLQQMLAKIIHEHPGRTIDPEFLAECFEKSQYVTSWHNDKLLKGKYKGFFLGNYKLLGHIAAGGMSNIYLAEHLQMRRRVAIKVLPPTLVKNSSHLSRFYIESRVIASLDHPNIVRAYDINQQENFHFLVMEYIDGPDLRELVHQKGPMSVEMAADYIRQAAEGLHHAHSKGVVHRDVKPANLLVDRDGVVKVLDLGLTRMLDSEDASLTLAHSERLIGTVDYIAPEQAANSHDVDARADIYSLGCTLYFLLVGEPPFHEGTQTQRLMAHQTSPPPDIRKRRPEVPQDLWELALRMMAKKPRDRQQSAAEVSRDLTRWLAAREDYRPKAPAIPGRHAPNLTKEGPISTHLKGDSNLDGEDLPSSLMQFHEKLINSNTVPASADAASASAMAQVQARQEALDARDAQLSQREGLLKELQVNLDTRQGEIDRREQELAESRGKLSALENYIEQRAAELERKTAEYEQRDIELERRERAVAARGVDLDRRAMALSALNPSSGSSVLSVQPPSSLHGGGSHLRKQMEELATQMASLHTQKQDFERQRAQFVEQLQQFQNARTELTKRQAAMQAQVEEITSKARMVTEKYREIEAYRQQLQRRESDLVARESKLGVSPSKG